MQVEQFWDRFAIKRYGGILVAVGLPLLVYLAQSLLLRGWLMDDAGISFAYARNLAHGYGLVSQPGMPPVEGYSNSLWVFLMVPFFWLHLFDPFITSKLISILLVAGSFYRMVRMSQLISGARWPGILASCFLATNASFIIWTSSGLENPLLVFLVLSLAQTLLNAVSRGEPSHRDAAVCALISVGLTLTRPEGVLFALAFPIVLILLTPLTKVRILRSLPVLSSYLGLVALGIGGFLLFRIVYFGDLYPNTYHVKGGPTLQSLKDLMFMKEPCVAKLAELSGSFLGRRLWSLAPIGLIVWVANIVRKRGQWKYHLVLATMTLVAWGSYMLMPPDWMGEFRMASALFPLVYLSAGLLAYWAVGIARPRRLAVFLISGIVAAALLGSIVLHYPRLKSWADAPIVSFSGIAERFGNQYNRWAEYLGVKSASLLVPDIGGTLFYSKLRIYDLAGLTDRTIALNRPNNEQFTWNIGVFYNYVFDTLRPTFIHTHGSFTMRSQFDRDPRFARDYEPIREYEDDYAGERLQRKIMSGDYVRRDVAAANPGKLQDIIDGKVR
jgi:hypothetical protein